MFNKHYIRLSGNAIIHGFSDALEQPQEDDICIIWQGVRHFELFGEINKPLRRYDGIPTYKWDGKSVIPRTADELGADMANQHASRQISHQTTK